jgi:uncharacterized protein YwqG
MTPAQFLRLAADYNLTHIARELLSTSLPGVRALEQALRQALPDDKTFIGGEPIPRPRQWPSYKETPLTFVAQVDTESLPPDACPVPLPAGLLQFFVPSTAEATDSEPSFECGRALFVPTGGSPATNEAEPDALDFLKGPAEPSARGVSMGARIARFFGLAARHEAPRTAKSRPETFPKRAFEWEVFPTLYHSAPDAESLWLPETARDFEFDHESDQDSYFDFRHAVMACSRWNWLVQMFGFANEQQGDMQPLVEAASGRRSLNEYREWVLLFALNSAHGGLAPETVCYYFWIHRDDLAEANFEEVWLCVQQD